MKNISKVLAISLFLIFGVIAANSYSISAAPTADPPSANISPIFYGLTVTTDPTTVKNLNVGGFLNANNGMDVYNQGLWVHSNFEADGDIYLNGKINRWPINGPVEIGNVTAVTPYDGSGDLYVAYDTSSNNVNARNDLSSNDDIFVGDDLFLNGGTGAYISNSDATTPVQFSDSISVNGNISVTGTSTSIGSYYTNYHTFTIDGGMHDGTNPKESGYRVRCNTNDIIVGCSAASQYIETADRFLGTGIMDNRTCSGRADDDVLGGGSNSDNLIVYARCFDPNGATSGQIYVSSSDLVCSTLPATCGW